VKEREKGLLEKEEICAREEERRKRHCFSSKIRNSSLLIGAFYYQTIKYFLMFVSNFVGN
jgi:hypothetical protein